VGVQAPRITRAAAALLIVAALASCDSKQQQPRAQTLKPNILLFTKTAGYRHPSITDAIAALRARLEGDANVVVTQDAETFSDERLDVYVAVVFLLTTGDVLNDAQQAAFQRYIQDGGGNYAGVHSASDTEHGWPFYGHLVGAEFLRHPKVQKATVHVDADTHPSTAGVPATWQRTDEWYNFRLNPRGFVHVLATVDEKTYTGGSMGADHPIAWCSNFGGGRSWYTGMGHTPESWHDATFVGHVAEGIAWAAGLVVGTCSVRTPPPAR
jgi:type 1 glutamine amidotransferase